MPSGEGKTAPAAVLRPSRAAGRTCHAAPSKAGDGAAATTAGAPPPLARPKVRRRRPSTVAKAGGRLEGGGARAALTVTVRAPPRLAGNGGAPAVATQERR